MGATAFTTYPHGSVEVARTADREPATLNDRGYRNNKAHG
jgi:hypothetical protein